MNNNLLLILTLAFLTTNLSAGVAKEHIYMCKVVSFDQTMMQVACDPNHPDHYMKTPRAWLTPNVELRSGTIVQLIMDENRWASWAMMNATNSKPGGG